jgi:hypothetical protein
MPSLSGKLSRYEKKFPINASIEKVFDNSLAAFQAIAFAEL